MSLSPHCSTFKNQANNDTGIQVFLTETLKQQNRSWKTKKGSRMNASIIPGEIVSDLLHHLDTQMSVGPDGIHARVLRELAEVLTKPLPIIYQQSCST